MDTHQRGRQRSQAVPAHAGKAPVGRDPEGRASAGRASEGRDLVQSLDRPEGCLAGRSQPLVGKAPPVLGCSSAGARRTLVEGVRTRCCEAGWFHPCRGTHFCPATWQKAQSAGNLGRQEQER